MDKRFLNSQFKMPRGWSYKWLFTRLSLLQRTIKMKAMYLSKQKELNADPKAIK